MLYYVLSLKLSLTVFFFHQILDYFIKTQFKIEQSLIVKQR